MRHTFRLLGLLLALAGVTTAQTDAFTDTSPADGRIDDREDDLGQDLTVSILRSLGFRPTKGVTLKINAVTIPE